MIKKQNEYLITPKMISESLIEKSLPHQHAYIKMSSIVSSSSD